MFRSNTVQNKPTRWGDKEQRRRDILEAARDQIEHRGYVGFNMRDLAEQAGVSPGTLYSYFANKTEIFATLYAEAIRAHNEVLAPACDRAKSVEELIGGALRLYIDLYAVYGRHFTIWSELAVSPNDKESALAPELIDDFVAATLEQANILRSGIERMLSVQGLRLERENTALTFLWTSFIGVADHFTTRRQLIGPDRDTMIAFAAGVLARGLPTVPRRAEK